MIGPSHRTLPDKTQHKTTISPAGFETAIPASEWPVTYALDRAATVIGYGIIIIIIIKHWHEHVPKSVETSQGGKVTISWN